MTHLAWRVVLTFGILSCVGLASDDWPTFRGPGARGVADGQNLPVNWGLESGRNIRWIRAIPGQGHSSPIVSRGRLFVTTAVASDLPDLRLGDEGGIDLARDDGEFSWRLYCLDAKSGEILWQREIFQGRPRAKRHVKSSQANATPVTDGETVVAILGSQGMAAFDFNGQQLWKTDLGRLNPGLFGDPSSEWGYSSSPVIHKDSVIVQVDRHKGSFLASHDLREGKLRWKIDRDERPVWATPTLHSVEGRDELIVVGGYFNRGYDPDTGKEIWSFRDEAEVKTPTPFVADGLIVFAGGYRGRPVFALRPGGRGDLSAGEGASRWLAWKADQGGPYTTTPLAYQGFVYAVRDIGVLHVYDLATGEKVYSQRTHATHASSPVASDGKIYFGTETGQVLVVKAGREYEELARMEMGDPVMATPAIARGTLFVRTLDALYAMGND